MGFDNQGNFSPPLFQAMADQGINAAYVRNLAEIGAHPD